MWREEVQSSNQNTFLTHVPDPTVYHLQTKPGQQVSSAKQALPSSVQPDSMMAFLERRLTWADSIVPKEISNSIKLRKNVPETFTSIKGNEIFPSSIILNYESYVDIQLEATQVFHENNPRTFAIFGFPVKLQTMIRFINKCLYCFPYLSQ